MVQIDSIWKLQSKEERKEAKMDYIDKLRKLPLHKRALVLSNLSSQKLS